MYFLKVLYLSILLWAVASCTSAQSSDSIILSYARAKERMLKENLRLLAAYYDISMAEADVLQAKLWNNPSLHWESEAYNRQTGEVLKASDQYALQINQTFSIAGKYIHTIRLAKKNKELAQIALLDVLRALLYDLGEQYLKLDALQEKDRLYQEIIRKYEQLIEGTQERLRAGAIPQNELTRLQAELLLIKSETIDNRNAIAEALGRLKTLLNIESKQTIITQDRNSVLPLGLRYEDVLQVALNNRPDYLLNKKQLEYEQQNLRLQRALAKPDIHLGYQAVDKASNYVPYYSGVALEMNIPLFNRNQGNIRKAKLQIDQVKTSTQYNELELRNEVLVALEQVQNTQQGLEEFTEEFLKTMQELNSNSQNNYDKRIINLLSYIDLQRIYIQNRLQYIKFKSEYQHAINRLNFIVGTQIIE